MDQYHICKNDDTRIKYDNEPDIKHSHGYFIISIEWMSVWRAFVNGKGAPPGMIDNKLLKQKILNARRNQEYPEDETDLGLADKEDFYILSVQFFKFFYDTYGCNTIIQVKYKTFEQRIEINSDPLGSTSRINNSMRGMKIDDSIIRGTEFSAIYEKQSEL